MQPLLGDIVDAPFPAVQRRAAASGDGSPAAQPAHPDSFLAVANMLCVRGEHALAVVCLRKALAIDPGNAQAHNTIGLALQQLGHAEEALSHHQRALALSPGMAEVHASLGNAHRMLGRLEEAVGHYENALSIRPGYAAAHNGIAGALHMLGRSNDAIAHYQRVLSAQPDDADAHYNLANVLVHAGRRAEAIPHYAKALEIRPGFPEARNNLGNVLQMAGRHDEAVAHYEAAVALNSGHAEAWHNLGKACFALDRHEHALAAYEKAQAIDPSRPMVHNDIANVHLVLGHPREAYAAFAAAVAREPRNAAIHLNLAILAPFTADDPRLAAVEKLAEIAPSLSENDQIALSFALGKAHADLGDNERSFRHLLDGNALKRRHLAYDEAAALDRLRRIRAVFTPELMREKSGCGGYSRVPTFIVGMPRSGTTLLEQILASHSGVFGAGEIDDFTRSMMQTPGASEGFPEFMSTLPIGELRHLGRRYIDRVGARAPGVTRIVDKMLSNFAYIGIIHLALPNARIIHACRDPVDTCLSCFSLLFAENQLYAYDLAELGRYYRAYTKLMRHWRAVLPEGIMLDVRYEDVVDDLEGQARRLITHCGLAWEDRCVAFHETQRPVRTASVTQVRRPIYRDSIGRWRPCRGLLQPLIDALEVQETDDINDNLDLEKRSLPEERRSFAEELGELIARRER
jgi:tetratricopeptide (TPR) repeat protein